MMRREVDLYRISVVIPCHNQGQFLSDALQSCVAQTQPPDEIIVVNDGSDVPHTLQIEAAIHACAMPVTYLKQPVSGVAHARNVGWSAASGDLVQFLDADDVLLPEKIARCVREFERMPDAAVVYTDYETRTADLSARVAQSSSARPIPKHNTLSAMLGEVSTFFSVGSALVRRDWLARVGGFNEDLKITEDWFLWITLASQGALFRFIPEPLVWYRNSPAGASKNALNLAEARLRAYEALRTLPIPPGLFDLNAARAERHHMLAMRLWEAGRASEAREHFRKAIAMQRTGRIARCALWGLSFVVAAPAARRIMAALAAVRSH